MSHTTEIYDVIIIGAGASGLICALECARAPKKVLVLEKSALPGRKILVSGNGRCNFTNRYLSADKYQADPSLINSVLQHFSFEDCLAYFDKLGVLYTEESKGRFFPQTNKATAVTDALKAALAETDADIFYNQEAVHIQKGKLFTVRTQNGLSFQAKKVVLSCGSCAYPQVSGTQRGYELARSLGHTIVMPKPALSGLVLKENFSRLTGIRAQVTVSAATQPAATADGEIIFTNYGINGPAALNISAAVSRALEEGNVPLSINFLPQLTNPNAFFCQRMKQFSCRKPKDFFAGLLHESIANLLIDFKGLRKNKAMNEQSPAALQHTFETVVRWPATVTALRGWNEAMIAIGGVNLREINYNTLESLRCPNLFITGELLDVAGISGGFNLHFAWASGFCAAQAITKES